MKGAQRAFHTSSCACACARDAECATPRAISRCDSLEFARDFKNADEIRISMRSTNNRRTPKNACTATISHSQLHGEGTFRAMIHHLKIFLGILRKKPIHAFDFDSNRANRPAK
jgi:hypothetical protein